MSNIHIRLAAAWVGVVVVTVALTVGAAGVPGVKDRPGAEQLPAIKELPDPFLFEDGTRVTRPEQWPARRAELAALVQYYQYGHLPPAEKRISAEVVETKELDAPGAGATQTHMVLHIGPEKRLRTRLLLTVPKGAQGKVPVIVRGDLCWGKVADPILAEVIRRGYALAEFDRTDLAADKKDVRGLIYDVYPEYDPSALAAWAWGYSRVIDYLETRPDIDATKIVATGHSRGGKTALLAGAMDARIAVTNPNNSGCGGAGSYRFQAPKSEDIAAITKNFPHWFHPRFREFVGRVERLPIDQHSVKALVAPRALLSTEALGDLWANPEGTQQTHLAAKEVWDFLGAPGKLGLVYREGKHEHNLADWTVLLDFSDQVLFGKKSDRAFDKVQFPDSPKLWSWKAPGRR